MCYAADSPRVANGAGIFRFAGRLPIVDPSGSVSLGEGETPLLDVGSRIRDGSRAARLRIKCESVNPTGSFKDRIAAVAASIMRERNIPGCVGTSSGNGGAAMAAYAARAGRSLIVFALSDTLPQKLLQIRATGAWVFLLRGLGHDAAATEAAVNEIIGGAIAHGLLPFVTASRFMPEAIEGAKTIAYELAEQAPEATVVYVPIGGGGLYSAIWRGYAELADELPNGPPRMVAVQPEGCATISRMLSGSSAALDRPVSTTISGLQVAFLFDAIGVKTAIEASGGHVVEVSDSAVWRAQGMLARAEGVLVEPAGATALAGVYADAEQGHVDAEDDIIVIATGAGYKDTQALERIIGTDPVPAIDCGQIVGVIESIAEGTPRARWSV